MADRHAGWAHLQMRPSAADEPAGYTVAFQMRVELANPEGARFVEMTDATYYATTPPFGLIFDVNGKGNGANAMGGITITAER